MSRRTVISVRGVGKRYDLGETFSSNTFRDALASGARRLFRKPTTHTRGGRGDFWALKDISFDVAEGEVLGVIGANGAGKSTLLKILSQITEPTEGEYRVRGRVAALLEVGTGFHPELSGRENVFMNGAILGMTQAEIRRKFDEIVAFSGVEAFIDTPIKRYSSGMLVRLGFAVAAHLEPEILVVDEVLAVGDAEFQQRCLGKMEDVSRSGRTVLFVSHSMPAVESLCTRALLLGAGCVLNDGSVAHAIEAYQSNVDTPAYDVDLIGHPARTIDLEPVLTRLQILNGQNEVARTLVAGRPATFAVALSPRRRLAGTVIGLHFYSMLGQRVMTLHSGYQAGPPPPLETDRVLECYCPVVRLAPGRYRLVVAVAVAGEQIDRIDPATSIDVQASDYYATGKIPPVRDGVFWPEARWNWS